MTLGELAEAQKLIMAMRIYIDIQQAGINDLTTSLDSFSNFLLKEVKRAREPDNGFDEALRERREKPW